MSVMMYREALRLALYEEMKRDDRVFLAGEDVGSYGGAYAVSRGLIQEFGSERLVGTPISEAAIIGMGIGAAMTGLRPVVELMYIDFVGLAMDQIANQAAKFRYMSGGQLKIPMVMRMQGGTGRSAGAQHSQSLEAWLVHIPGLRVVMPASARDARGLLKTAIRSDDPVVFIEHKGLYAKKEEVPEEEELVPFGKARIARSGSDVTLITYSRMVYTALEAAEEASAGGIDVEVIDLRTLNPLDYHTIEKSVRKTGTVVVAYEAHRNVGMGSEISARIGEELMDVLKHPVVRIGGKDVPIPATVLEKYSIPQKQDLLEGIEQAAGR
ncbi:MAG: alpha-ketoacid dehydrogenase subunit beta [Spirochaetales bacterium]|nr:alpha-ketoacid dehydrogenase subunit beta [Spirochaetales bacterium]MCF7937003.1 alpha-ketoacid dehydrogenase subunit beta [Spirochaetales bacterium]